MKPFDQACRRLESAEKSYALSISGEGFSTNITAKEGGIQLDSDKVIAAAKGGMNPALWFVNMDAHDATENLTASADSTALRNLLTEEIEEFNAVKLLPKMPQSSTMLNRTATRSSPRSTALSSMRKKSCSRRLPPCSACKIRSSSTMMWLSNPRCSRPILA